MNDWYRDLQREAQAFDFGATTPQPEDPEYQNSPGDLASLSGNEFRVGDRNTPGITPPLALEENILARFRSDLARAGVAGEEGLASLVYLALTSRVLPWGDRPTERPVSVIAKGTTSTGKSHTLTTVLRFFPESAYVQLGSMSRKFLFYDEEDYAHRFVVVPEWASIADDEEVVALLRTLLSEGRVIHGTVEGDGRRTPRRIEKNGPTGLLMTTTAAEVDAEMETRVLAVVTDDTPEQTRRVFLTLARLDNGGGDPIDFDRWHELQTWIAEQGEVRVAVRFVELLAKLMPDGATRLRRDFVSLLCLVRAHAVLHQATRERDVAGRIVATADDYAAARELVADVLAEGADAGVSAAMRETVEAARVLLDGGAEHVRPKDLIDRLRVGQSACYDRIRRALRAGYLVNEAAKNERGMRLVLGAALPGEDDFLPSVEDVFRVDSRSAPGNENPYGERESEACSAIPAIPVDPPEEPAEDTSEADYWAEPIRSLGAALRLGDEGFPELVLARALRAGHITEAEANERYALHKLVERR